MHLQDLEILAITSAPVIKYSSAMSLSPSHSCPPKRPRLSLQTKSPATSQTFGKSTVNANVDPASPTAFNTLSNAYAVAIENSSPRTGKPSSAFEYKTKRTSLRLETKLMTRDTAYIHPSQRTQTPGPFSITYPDTPSSAFPNSTPTTARPETKPNVSASSFTFTPPQSAGSDKPMARVFTFAANSKGSPTSPRTPRRRAITSNQYQAAPYTHPRSLHSILRNSPLPPRSTATPATPSRMSMRLANRGAKKVGYNDPLTQTITTNKYVKSHIDLLSEGSPHSAADPESEKLETVDLAMEYTKDETRNGGRTPGAFEEMRRRLAESDLETPRSRKRKRREKKRKWEWTITSPVEGEGEGGVDEGPGKTPVTAVKIDRTPNTAIWRGASVSTTDSDMSDAEDLRFGVSVDAPTDAKN